jgi:hypothetical protein
VKQQEMKTGLPGRFKYMFGAHIQQGLESCLWYLLITGGDGGHHGSRKPCRDSKLKADPAKRRKLALFIIAAKKKKKKRNSTKYSRHLQQDRTWTHQS